MDIGVEPSTLAGWFTMEKQTPYVLVRVSAGQEPQWPNELGVIVRRCYVDDSVLDEHERRTNRSRRELIAAKLPDQGSTMAGEFGEILVFLYHVVAELNSNLIGPMKLRLKNDRTKPASYSDVVHFVVPNWPEPSDNDRILCSEVKTKSTPGSSKPISDSIVDCKKDRTGRLARTLAWLKECALYEDLGSVTIDLLERFIKATDHPPAEKTFRAVSVICESLVNEELPDAPDSETNEYKVVIIAVPSLKELYEAVYRAALTGNVPVGGAN